MDRHHCSRPAGGPSPLCGLRRKVCLTLGLGLMLAGCATAPTHFSSTWRDATYTGPPVEPVAVLALFKSQAEDRTFETQAVSMLEARGVDAVAGYTLLTPGRQYTQEQMQEQLKTANVGGVLIFRLIGENKEHEYVNPAPYFGPMPPGVIWGDPFYWYYYPQWNYYWYWRSSLSVAGSPGYWAETTYYVIESSLYDNKTSQLLWTAKSKTLDDTQFETVANSVAKRVADRLVDLGLVQSNSKYAATGSSQGSKNEKQTG
jgi:hypothetical protein